MNIPEIRFEVAKYLNHHDLCACALVSQSWNHTFTPSLYREINDKNVWSAGIVSHPLHVRKLRLPMFDNAVKHLPTGSFTRVQELEVTWDHNFAVPPIWTALLQQNPELVKLVTHNMTPNLLVDIMSVHPFWQELVVQGQAFSYPPAENCGDNWVLFLKVCQGLTRLRLLNGSIPAFPKEPVPHDKMLLTMRHLTVLSPLHSASRQMQLVSACKNLETLQWEFRILSEDVDDMGPEALRNLFQSLSRLRETSIYIHLSLASESSADNWVGAFLTAFPPLKGFQDTRYRERDSTIGLVAGPLSKHFSTLERLNLRGWKEVTSSDNHLILISCPNLQTFESKEYEIGKIPLLSQVTLSPYNRFTHGQGPLGWICTRLTNFTLEFVHETHEKSRLMFEQLSHLKKLEFVKLHGEEASGLDPTLIQWDDGASSKYWVKGTIRYIKDGTNPDSWVHRIWPNLRSFSTYS